MRPEGCPSPLLILSWLAGRCRDVSEESAVGAHLASCASPCGEDLQVARAVMEEAVDDVMAVMDHVPAQASEAETRSIEAMVAAASRRTRDVARIFEADPPRWPALLLAHPDGGSLDLLFVVADGAVYHADEKPAEVLRFVPVVRELLSAFPDTEPERGRVDALLALAEGVARRTEGDHLGALEAYTRAEASLPEPVLEVEYPRINLARAASLRRLGRYDEARRALELARQGFARCGTVGESKALWQLANIAWETGEHRAAVKLAARAHRLLVREGSAREAAVALWTVVAPLIAMRRPSPVRRILATLARDPVILENPYERARLRWNQGMLATLEGDWPLARGLLEDAARTFAEAGAFLDAARVTLDRAHVAGERGDVPEQALCAGRASAILSRIPGQEGDWAAASAELRQALGSAAAVAQVVASLRTRLKRS